MSILKQSLVMGSIVAAAVASAGCKGKPAPVDFAVSIPQPDTVAFRADIKNTYGAEIQGTFNLPAGLGTLTLTPETGSSGLGFAFTLNTQSFLKPTWASFREVMTLPTGADFPSWMSGPVVDVSLPAFQTGPVDYHVFLGTHGQWYAGIAGIIKHVDEDFPAVNVSYAFRDKKGNVIVGLKFFGPALDDNGHVTVPGGIFIGTNVSPFLGRQGLGMESIELSEAALSGEPTVINGRSVVAQLSVTGPEAGRYRSAKAVRGLVRRYLAALRDAR